MVARSPMPRSPTTVTSCCLACVDGLDRARVPGGADSLLLGDAADRLEPERIEARHRVAVERIVQERVEGGENAVPSAGATE